MEAAKGCTDIHEGQNIRRLRAILDIPQKELAVRMDMSQQRISDIENLQTLDDETRNKIAKAMGVPPALISNYDHKSVINIISDNTFSGEGSGSQLASTTSTFTQNNTTYPIEHLIEMFGKAIKEENSKTATLWRLLETEKERYSILEQKINNLSTLVERQGKK